MRPFNCRRRCQKAPARLDSHLDKVTSALYHLASWRTLTLTPTIQPIQIDCTSERLILQYKTLHHDNIGGWSRSTNRWEVNASIRVAIRRWLRFREFIRKLRRRRTRSGWGRIDWRQLGCQYRSDFTTSCLFWWGIPSIYIHTSQHGSKVSARCPSAYIGDRNRVSLEAEVIRSTDSDVCCTRSKFSNPALILINWHIRSAKFHPLTAEVEFLIQPAGWPVLPKCQTWKLLLLAQISSCLEV